MEERNFCIEAPISCTVHLTESFGVEGWLNLIYLVVQAAMFWTTI